VVTICTTTLTLKILRSAHTVYLCVLCWSQNKQPLFPYTTLTDWFYNIDLILYSPVVTICTTSLTFNNSTFCPHSAFMFFVCISEQRAIISLYNINWLVFITQTQCVYCAVRTGTSNVIQIISALFWDITQRQVVIPCRRFGISYRFHLQMSRNPSSKDGVWYPKRPQISSPSRRKTEITNIIQHVVRLEERSKNFDKRLLPSSCLSVRVSVCLSVRFRQMLLTKSKHTFCVQ